MHTRTVLPSLVLAAACQQQADPTLNEKLDRLNARMDAIDRKLDAISRGAGRAAAQRPPGPDPSTVYSVPIDPTDPVRGPATAPVTIIEAAEFG